MAPSSQPAAEPGGGGVGFNGVRSRILLEATRQPVSGFRPKPTFLLGPALMTVGDAAFDGKKRPALPGSTHRLEVEIRNVKAELRLGVVSLRYAETEPGRSFHSRELAADVGYLLLKGRQAMMLRGEHPLAGKECGVAATGDVVVLELRFGACVGDATLHASKGGVPIAKLAVGDIFEKIGGGQFAVQFFDEGDAVVASDVSEQLPVRILHISDTHGLHRSIEAAFPFPPADILLHTGDYTNNGLDWEHDDFNTWLGELQPRIKHIVIIGGNHEYGCREQNPDPAAMIEPDYLQKRLTNATRVLDHELAVIEGVRIFGSPWVAWSRASAPDLVAKPDLFGAASAAAEASGAPRPKVHRFDEIPEGTDILMTHGPALGIFDWVGNGIWGSSSELLAEIHRAKPKCHLFGHLHEQRGQWTKTPNGTYAGGVEYSILPGAPPFAPVPARPPSRNYPVQLVSCNAMKNHPGLEGGTPAQIAGPARLILATGSPGSWTFTAQPAL